MLHLNLFYSNSDFLPIIVRYSPCQRKINPWTRTKWMFPPHTHHSIWTTRGWHDFQKLPQFHIGISHGYPCKYDILPQGNLASTTQRVFHDLFHEPLRITYWHSSTLGVWEIWSRLDQSDWIYTKIIYTYMMWCDVYNVTTKSIHQKSQLFLVPHRLGAWSDDWCNTIGTAILEQLGMN